MCAMKIWDIGLAQRKPGYQPKSGVTFIAGLAATLASSDPTGQTLSIAAGGSCIGLVQENTTAPTCSLLTNFGYDQYNRGGLVSYVCGSGVEVELWNDGAGNVFDTYSTFTIDAPVYSTVNGLISPVVLGNIIGRVTKVPTSPTDSLKIQLSL